jgi:hypothetical protein
MVRSLAPRLIGAPMLLNVNFPALARADVRGVRVTRLGKRHVAEPVIKDENPRGETIYWIGPAGSAKEAGPGTDFHAVAEGWVSVTPLDIDLTGTKLLDTVGGWFPDGGAMTERRTLRSPSPSGRARHAVRPSVPEGLGLASEARAGAWSRACARSAFAIRTC